MDNTELHYLTYDPDAIYDKLQDAYLDAGGDILYPGDEKAILLNAVQAILVQAFAGVDHAIRMGTLRYAVGDYLDAIGETRLCDRIQAKAATATVTITETGDGQTRTIPAGTTVTADGGRLYSLDSDLTVSGAGGTHTVGVTCTETGTDGNGLTAETQLQFMILVSGVASIVCATAASGGMDEETDDAYRERIRTSGAAIITTGTAMQYEAVAKSVSSDIIDAKAVNLSAGKVGIYLILTDGAASSGVIAAVTAALNGNDTRPLTDTVTVSAATDVSYTIKVQYKAATGSDISAAVTAAIAEYQAWQDETIGQAFNPDRLMALLYQAGCTRVTWGTGSAFNGGTVQYTEIESSKRCKGTITATRVVT